MGVKTMQFMTIDGDSITVTFSGDRVADGTLVPAAQPVVMQADGGGGEYIPVKYTTCTVTCLTDGLELGDMISLDPMDVRVSVYNASANKYLFHGFLSPNVYNQPISGINDTLSIECVDWLGIAQFLPYRREGESFRTFTIGEAVRRIVALISRDSLSVGIIGLADNVRIVSSDGIVSTAAYEHLEVSEAYFFDSPLTPDIEEDGALSYERQALSCYDVLSMIAETFRSTFVQIGGDIILLDALTMQGDGVSRMRVLRGDDTVITQNYSKQLALTEDIVDATESISVLRRAHSASVATPTGKAIPLLPDLFSPSNLVRNGEMTHTTTTAGNNTIAIHYEQPLNSRIIDIPNYSTVSDNGNTRSVAIVAVRDIDVPYGTSTPENVNLVTQWDDNSGWESYIRLYVPDPAKEILTQDGRLFTIKKEFRMPCVSSRHYSIRLRMSAGRSDRVDSLAPIELRKDITNLIFGVVLQCGDKYYDIEQRDWVEERVSNTISVYGKDKEWKDELYDRFYLGNMLAENTVNGTINVELYGSKLLSGSDVPHAIYIKDLQLELAPDVLGSAACAYFPRPKTRTYGSFDFNDNVEAVKIPFSFGFPISERPFGTIVDGVEYATVYNFVDYNKPYDIKGGIRFLPSYSAAVDEAVEMPEHIYSINNMGDRREMQIRVRDVGNSLSLATIVTCPQLWQGNKIIVAMEKNIADNSATITVN